MVGVGLGVDIQSEGDIQIVFRSFVFHSVESEICLDELEDGVYLRIVIHSIDYGGQILLGWGMLEI